MNIAINKAYKSGNMLSRYSAIPYYYNIMDEKYFSGITSWLKNNTTYIEHIIVSGDSLDSLALSYYGNPTYYWIIADFNRIIDPLSKLKIGEKIKIPDFSNIKFD